MNEKWKRFISEETSSHNQLALHVFDPNSNKLSENSAARKTCLILYNTENLGKLLSDQEFLKAHVGSADFNRGLVESGLFLGTITYYSNRYDKNTCFDASEVVRSAVFQKHQGKGFGKLLYLLAMSKLYPTPLMADRFSVSSKAERVWKSLERDEDVGKVPPKEPPYTGQFDDIEKPTTPPENDDCGLHKPAEKHSAINRAYVSAQKRGLVKLLEGRDAEFLSAMTQRAEKDDTTHYSMARLNWRLVGGILFGHEYGDGA